MSRGPGERLEELGQVVEAKVGEPHLADLGVLQQIVRTRRTLQSRSEYEHSHRRFLRGSRGRNVTGWLGRDPDTWQAGAGGRRRDSDTRDARVGQARGGRSGDGLGTDTISRSARREFGTILVVPSSAKRSRLRRLGSRCYDNAYSIPVRDVCVERQVVDGERLSRERSGATRSSAWRK